MASICIKLIFTLSVWCHANGSMIIVVKSLQLSNKLNRLLQTEKLRLKENSNIRKVIILTAVQSQNPNAIGMNSVLALVQYQVTGLLGR